MAVILGVQICTTATKVPVAEQIILKMEDLLVRRAAHQIGRRGFLIAWGKLRLGLRLTDDYQKLVERVRKRAGGTCEFCLKRPGIHVHHVKPVAFYPRLALMDMNCTWSCKQCHPLEDKRSRAAALGDRTLQTRRAEKGQYRIHSEAPPRRAEGALQMSQRDVTNFHKKVLGG